MKCILLLVAFFQVSNLTWANVQLPKFFSNNMVLQRDHTIPIWGWADQKEKITVQLNHQAITVFAGKDGKWRVDLIAENAGGPYILAVKGKNVITIKNVLIGDVWVCSGQSNMEMPIGDWGFINNYQEEIAVANYPFIRQFKVAKQTAIEPQNDVSGGEWKLCNPENAAEFSAVAYFFGRELNKQLNVPIGLINTTWGGTHSETWTSRDAFEKSEEYKSMISGMKIVNIQELIKLKQNANKLKVDKLKGPIAPNAATIASWKNDKFNDASWQSIKVPGLWETQELGEFDGVVWFRKTIELDGSEAGKAATIHLSTIDDNDETYVNGEKVGATSGYDAVRNYEVAPGILKVGKNVIVVRITDNGGGGGFWGKAEDLQLIIGEKMLPLAGDWVYNIESIALSVNTMEPNSYPTLLFNAMLHPLIPFAIKGVIWYQGESNASRAFQYRKAFPLMINDWRKSWNQGNFPFYFVQLSSFNSNNGNSQKGSEWAELREAQTLTLSLPNTGMAVTTDIGNATDVHPKNKQEVGKRLAAIALKKTYRKNIMYCGPVYQSYQTQGNKIAVIFSNVSNGMRIKDKYGYLKGFEIAGSDQKFYNARALIERDKIIVWSDAVNRPLAVRFGWADDAGEDNLYNNEGFPAAPFRTDNWKEITEYIKYSIGQ